MNSQKKINGDAAHELLVKKLNPELSFADGADFSEWKSKLAKKLRELLGLDKIEKNACPLKIDIEWEEVREGYRVTRFTFESEPGAVVPCYLLLPDTDKEKYPVAICLQGHTTGFHLSIGEGKHENDERYLPNNEFAIQAVREGFAALAIEQRGMGERRSPRSYGADNTPYPRPHMCAVQSLDAIMLGRTILGERVFDVMCAIDLLENFPRCDTGRIVITGNSGGGTASFYAACCDGRIKISAPSCSFCSYSGSILNIEHCACNYIPNAASFFEMQDLSALIAPRKLIVVTGREDEIFPIDEVRASYATVEKIFAKAGVPDSCRLVETPNAHYWRPDLVWSAICGEAEKLGWFN